MSKVLAAALGAAGALAVANTASADTQVQVQSGDTVWGFAQQYATTVDSISTANQLADPNVIYVGQQLVIPSSAVSAARSEEHTSELQSRFDLVCRLLLEKKKLTIILYYLYLK